MKIFLDFFLRDFLTESEVEFGLSVYKFYVLNGFISDKQKDALERILHAFDGDPFDDEIPF
jgi:hypothetical protein